MEQIYPPSFFDSSEKLTDLDGYFKSYFELSKFVSQNDIELENDQLIFRKLNELLDVDDCSRFCDDSSFRTLSNVCSTNTLTVSNEIIPCDVHQFTRHTLKLHKVSSMTEAAEDLETIKAKVKYDGVLPRKKEFINMVLKHDTTASNDDRDLNLDHSLIVVRIYLPFIATLKKLNRRGDKLTCSHEIVALTSNLLSELRDKIVCASDNGLCVDIDDLKANPVQDVKAEYPSALIGIDDTLYVDMRSPNAIDYSEVIQQWAVQKKIPKFKTVPMDQVRLQDLNFRLAYPYIYQHRGNCEHIIIFSDVRLIKRSDPLCRSEYPFYRSINRYSVELCNICHVATAKWLLCECDRLPHDRTFLCQDCFMSYNYIDGKRIGNFKAYPYYSRSSVL
ncbi:snrna-activating protein complex subunit 3 [Holotrichia oblita]|uniref:Snrna-activating protein complex subunit 3 n=1 Tax=Holotrichia oblita TaxID=644536 RepID=A0ACB9SWD7_HOLOL|nr:snrna-activating protein complex subunit 3 [Holotrichia oblita]